MNNLTEKMQERLDKWRKKPVIETKPSTEKNIRRGGKGDYGDVLSIEEWEEEAKKSQTRK